VIRHDTKFAARQQHAPRLRKERILHNPVLVVLALRPRIGEVQMDHPHHRIRAAPPKELARIRVQHPHVGQDPPPHPIRCIKVKLPGILDTEVVHLRIGRALLKNEPALPAPDLDLKRPRRICEPRARLNPPRKRVRHDRIR
jgi:hypothetical protein